jgi:hypothetical protein
MVPINGKVLFYLKQTTEDFISFDFFDASYLEALWAVSELQDRNVMYLKMF